MRVDRKRLKCERLDLLGKTKELYKTIESKENEIGGLLKSFEKKTNETSAIVKRVSQLQQQQQQQATLTTAKMFVLCTAYRQSGGGGTRTSGVWAASGRAERPLRSARVVRGEQEREHRPLAARTALASDDTRWLFAATATATGAACWAANKHTYEQGLGLWLHEQQQQQQ